MERKRVRVEHTEQESKTEQQKKVKVCYDLSVGKLSMQVQSSEVVNFVKPYNGLIEYSTALGVPGQRSMAERMASRSWLSRANIQWGSMCCFFSVSLTYITRQLSPTSQDNCHLHHKTTVNTVIHLQQQENCQQSLLSYSTDCQHCHSCNTVLNEIHFYLQEKILIIPKHKHANWFSNELHQTITLQASRRGIEG